jgi:hypothetical protein
MLGVAAFFLLLTVFSLAAQLVGYIDHLRAKARRETQEEASHAEWFWPDSPTVTEPVEDPVIVPSPPSHPVLVEQDTEDSPSLPTPRPLDLLHLSS